MSRTLAKPIATFSGPPADRMAGRAQARAARAQAQSKGGSYTQAASKVEPRVSAATEASASSFLAREELLDRAIASGVIQPGLRGHYARAYDADPDGCRAFLGKLPGGANLASTVVASAAEDDGLSLLTDAERQNVMDARAGRRPRFVHGG
jgi:hypothetical protein